MLAIGVCAAVALLVDLVLMPEIEGAIERKNASRHYAYERRYRRTFRR